VLRGQQKDANFTHKKERFFVHELHELTRIKEPENVFIRVNQRNRRTKFFGATATLYSIATRFSAWSAFRK
jgi:hypothetical protein